MLRCPFIIWLAALGLFGTPELLRAAAETTGMSSTATRSNHWSLQPLGTPRPPLVTTATAPSQTAIDQFVVTRLAAAGLSMAPEADRVTLLRRLSFDLIGLPPTPEELDAFVADPSPDAYEKQVERLLASPRYGER